MARSRIAVCAFALCLAAASGSAQEQEIAATSGFNAGLGLVDQRVTRIGIGSNVNLEQFGSVLRALTSNGQNPFRLGRNVEFYASKAGVSLDLAYLPNLIFLEDGVTVTFTGLRLLRIEAGIPAGVFQKSPGATVVIQDCDDHLQVGAPSDFAEAFFLNVPRTDGGTQSGRTDENGDFVFEDVQFAVPVSPRNLGGYNIRWLNSKLTADTRAPKPAECPEQFGGLPGRACNVAVLESIRSTLCTLPGCINFCKSQC